MSTLDALTQALTQVVRRLGAGADAKVTFERPKDTAHGDFATSVALSLARSLKRSPQDLATEIAQELAKHPDIAHAEVAGPGFVNITLTPTAFIALLQDTAQMCEPQPTRKHEAPVIIDFCGPNIAKPLGAHHLGSHIIGQAIINIHRHLGEDVIGWSYPGDWGTQFGKLAVAFEQWGDQEKPVADHSVEELLSLYVKFHEEVEKHPELEERARQKFRQLEEGDAALHAFWADVVKVTRKDLEEIYERIHVHVDTETGESFYQDKMAPILAEGMKKGVFQEGEGGALIVKFPEELNLPPFMVRKGDGSTLYATRDLAMIRYRIDTCHPSAMYYVVDVAQSLHFKQLFGTVKLLGWDLPHLEHAVFGRMRFEGAAMSTRKGTALRMRALLDEAEKRAAAVIDERGERIRTSDSAGLATMMGVGSVAYGILSQNRIMDIVFDWEKFLSFDGNSAPYIQYTYARSRSVLRKAGLTTAVFPKDLREFTASERILVATLAQFSAALTDARAANAPHILAQYLYQLAQTFNAFYSTEIILQSEEPQRSFRLALTDLTGKVLKCGAEMLTMRVPEEM